MENHFLFVFVILNHLVADQNFVKFVKSNLSSGLFSSFGSNIFWYSIHFLSRQLGSYSCVL